MVIPLEKSEHPESGLPRAGTRHLKRIGKIKALQGVVFISIKQMALLLALMYQHDGVTAKGSAGSGSNLARQGQQLMRDQALPVRLSPPFTAPVWGRRNGAGRRHRRICTDDVKAVLGLPEVQLETLPGSGGTATSAAGGVEYRAGYDLTGKAASRQTGA